MALEKFWASVPRLLEAAIVLQLALDKYLESTTIAELQLFNAALGLLRRVAPGQPLPR
jgi:H+-transporting ATPase